MPSLDPPSQPAIAHDPEASPDPQASADYQRAIAYLYARINYEKTADSHPYPFRLRRMQELLDRLDLHGIAGRDCHVIHIAGTKGKGSTSQMVASMLTQCGLRTGLYTSPHLNRLEERFQVDGQLPGEAEVVALVDQLATHAEQMAQSDVGAPTFFEMTTTLALMHFRQRGCQAVVLEVGLGGRLDSTNVCYPTVTAITSIGLDHQHILGHTHAAIAAQKAGIIKPRVPVVNGVRVAEANQVIRQIAHDQQAPSVNVDEHFRCVPCDDSLGAANWTMTFDYLATSSEPFGVPGQPSSVKLHNRRGWSLAMDGLHQVANAGVALTIMDLLAQAGVPVPLEAQRLGLANCRVPGRVERFRLGPDRDLILDTSHNEDSIASLCRCIESRRLGRPVTIVFGTSRDKDHGVMLQQLHQQADQLILTQYHSNPRYREIADLLAAVPETTSQRPVQILAAADPVTAVNLACAQACGPQLIVVCGSFFLAAEVRPMLLERQQQT